MHTMMTFKDQRGLTTFWGISIILMVVVVVVFVFYILYFFWIENPVPTSEILLVRVVRHQAVAIPSDAAAATWLTYEDPAYYVSFRYPDQYQLGEDDMYYGTNAGHVISLRQDADEWFSLRLFPVQADEEMAAALQRLTGIDPSIYQSFDEEIDGEDAVIYRQEPGTPDNDRIYFIHAGYLYEAPYNASTAKILSTFKLL